MNGGCSIPAVKASPPSAKHDLRYASGCNHKLGGEQENTNSYAETRLKLTEVSRFQFLVNPSGAALLSRLRHGHLQSRTRRVSILKREPATCCSREMSRIPGLPCPEKLDLACPCQNLEFLRLTHGSVSWQPGRPLKQLGLLSQVQTIRGELLFVESCSTCCWKSLLLKQQLLRL